MIIEGADEQLLRVKRWGVREASVGTAMSFLNCLLNYGKNSRKNRLEEARETQLDIAKIVNVLKYGNIPLLKYALITRYWKWYLQRSLQYCIKQ